MHKEYLVAGALLAATAVALGAFGAHGLQNIVSDETIIQNFRTGDIRTRPSRLWRKP